MSDSLINLGLFIFWITTLFSLVTILTFSFSKIGLYGIVIVTFIAANIQFLKEISLPYIPSIPLGSELIACNYFAIDLLNQFFSKKHAENALKISLILGVFWTFIFFYTGLFIPSYRSDKIHEAFNLVFGLSFKAFFSSYISYFISQYINIFLFNFMKHRISLYIRSVISTSVSSLLDYFIFILLFYVILKGDTMPFLDLLYYFLFINYLLRIAISFYSLPFLWLIRIYKFRWLKHKRSNIL